MNLRILRGARNDVCVRTKLFVHKVHMAGLLCVFNRKDSAFALERMI